MNKKDQISVKVAGRGQRTEYRDYDRIVPFAPEAGAPVAPVAAVGTIELTAQAVDGDSVVINDQKYVFVDTLSAEPTVPNEIKISNNAANTATNLKKAINGEATAGTNYSTGTQKPKDVSATILGAAITLTAGTAGVAAHNYPLSGSDEATFTITPFADGVDGTVAALGKMLIDAANEKIYIALAPTTVSDGSGWREIDTTPQV